MPSLGWIEFASLENKPLRFVCLLGDGSPTPTAGYGGWIVKDRERRTGLTRWPGVGPLEMDIPVLFDSFAEGDGLKIENDIRQLEKMAGLDTGVDEPPLVMFDSAGVVPHDAHGAPQNIWVIKDIQWGDADRNQYGNRTRQAATIQVMLYVEDGVLTNESSAARRKAANAKKKSDKGKKKNGAKSKKYTVKNGDTLQTIAKKELKKTSRWKEIVKLNKNLRDPRKKLQPGTILNMP